MSEQVLKALNKAAASKSAQIVKQIKGRPRDEPIYIGFGEYPSFLDQYGAKFTYMHSNRAISKKVVDERVQGNKDCYRSTSAMGTPRYLDFGVLSLVLLKDEDTDKEFLVMDGQHRIETMKQLLKDTKGESPPWAAVPFQFRLIVVGGNRRNMNPAKATLDHFQLSYPSDPRSFFETRGMNDAANEVVKKLTSEFGEHPTGIFKFENAGQASVNKPQAASLKDPARPYLNHFLVFNLLKQKQSGEPLLGGESVLKIEGMVSHAFKALVEMNQFLMRLPTEKLTTRKGDIISQKMLDTAEASGCYLGFFRDQKFTWEDGVKLKKERDDELKKAKKERKRKRKEAKEARKASKRAKC